MGAAKTTMPSTPQCPGAAESAAAQMPGERWPSKPTLFYWESTRPDAQLHQQL